MAPTTMPSEHHDVSRFGPLLSTVAVPFLIAVGGFVGANFRYVIAAVGLARLLVG